MRKHLTVTELDAQLVELLPTRETLSFNTNWANVVATNSSLALNAASVYSIAHSSAFQAVQVNQS